MNLNHAVGTIASRGFTERRAPVLVLVARHSGVCVMRQYSAFAGVVFGHTTRKFTPSSNDSVGSRPTTARASERASTTCAIGSCTRPWAMPSPPSASAHRAARARAHHAARRHPE